MLAGTALCTLLAHHVPAAPPVTLKVQMALGVKSPTPRHMTTYLPLMVALTMRCVTRVVTALV